MAVNFLHVGKTGGTAVKWALRRAGLPDTPYGPVRVHRHTFRMRDVPPEDHVIFFVRDPIARFMSGFYSRLNKGQPRYHYEWTAKERDAFAAFPTPQALAAALAGDDPEGQARARAATLAIRHTRPMVNYVGTPRDLRRRRQQILYIGRLETLAADWAQIRDLLELPSDLRLPKGRWRAHRQLEPVDKTLDDAGRKALEQLYASDYRLVRYCDRVRRKRGWGVDGGG